MADLGSGERAKVLVEEGVERARRHIRSLGGQCGDQLEADVRSALALSKRLRDLASDTGLEIIEAIQAGKRVLLEGAQGTALDLDHGTYPFVTSSSTTAGGAATGSGIGPTVIDTVIGVVKAYTTRVGNGPLPTAFDSAMDERVRTLGGEFGATTGRPRRCGWFDAVLARYSARVEWPDRAGRDQTRRAGNTSPRSPSPRRTGPLMGSWRSFRPIPGSSKVCSPCTRHFLAGRSPLSGPVPWAICRLPPAATWTASRNSLARPSAWSPWEPAGARSSTCNAVEPPARNPYLPKLFSICFDRAKSVRLLGGASSEEDGSPMFDDLGKNWTAPSASFDSARSD